MAQREAGTWVVFRPNLNISDDVFAQAAAKGLNEKDLEWVHDLREAKGTPIEDQIIADALQRGYSLMTGEFQLVFRQPEAGEVALASS